MPLFYDVAYYRVGQAGVGVISCLLILHEVGFMEFKTELLLMAPGAYNITFKDSSVATAFDLGGWFGAASESWRCDMNGMSSLHLLLSEWGN